MIFKNSREAMEAFRPLAERLAQETERLAKDKAWAEQFTCEDLTGAMAPCAGRGDMLVAGWDGGRMRRCPIAPARQCRPWQRKEEHERLEAADIAARAEASRRAAVVERKIQRGIPSRFMMASLDGQQTPAIKAVRAFLDEGGADGGEALVLLGGIGCGKTTAICAAAATWPKSALFLEADLIARLAARDHERLAEVMKSGESVSLLALDDLYRGHVPDFAGSLIEELLCHRHARERATIISSNLTPDQLSKRLSPRVVDRFREWATILTLPPGSLRMRA